MSLVTSLSANNVAGAGAQGPKTTTGTKVIVATMDFYFPSGTPDLADNKGNTYTPLAVQHNAGTNLAQVMYYCLAPNVGSGHTWTVSTGQFVDLAVGAWDDDVDTLDVSTGANDPGGVTTIHPGSATPTGASDLAVLGVASTNTPSGVSGYTQVGSTVAFAFFGSLWAATVSSATNPTFTAVGSSFNACTLALFYKAGGGGGGGPFPWFLDQAHSGGFWDGGL